jgi:hypothetical protein
VDVAIVFGTLPLETEKTITVTVTKTNFNDGKLHITTADVSTPENTDKTIELTLNQYNDSNYTRTFAILGGVDANKFTLAGNKLTFIATAFEARSDATYHVKPGTHGGFDINMISGITSGFKSRGYES